MVQGLSLGVSGEEMKESGAVMLRAQEAESGARGFRLSADVKPISISPQQAEQDEEGNWASRRHALWEFSDKKCQEEPDIDSFRFVATPRSAQDDFQVTAFSKVVDDFALKEDLALQA